MSRELRWLHDSVALKAKLSIAIRSGAWLAGRGSVAAVNSAELLDRIEQAAIDGDVIKALLLCQKLGSDAESTALADWARHELKGYPESGDLPEYRRVRTQLFCDGAAPGQRISGVPIPLDALPSGVQAEMAKGLALRGSISELAARTDEQQSKFAPRQMGAML